MLGSPRSLRLAASGTLGLVMAAHVMLETGVDALFLANIPVERLPFVTIAMAFVALGVSQIGARRAHRDVLVVLQALASLGTLAFFVLQRSGNAWVYYGLYAWAGIATSLIVVRFWLLLGDLFTITEGKRLFASIEVHRLQEIAEDAKKHPIVLVPSHRSYFDFLILSWLFYQSFLVPPHIEAGTRVVVNTADGSYSERAKD